MHAITPCLWFNGVAKEAAEFYVSVFKDGRVVAVSYYGPDMPLPEGEVLAVEFEIRGNRFTAINAGDEFKFNESVSFQIACEDQAEIDYFWERLTADGGQEGPCGWLKDRYGLSWQVQPKDLMELHMSGDQAALNRMMAALMTMKKLDWATLKAAYDRTE